jgi:capsule polysaccharide export protein KpsE/RkpR
MSKDNGGFDILDYFLIFFKWKYFFLVQFISVMIISYLLIYFFIPPKYDSSALIIPSKQEQLSGLSSVLRSFSSLPIGLGGLSADNSIDRYNTIVYSRTNLDSVIKKFDLVKEYNLESVEKTEKALRKNITADETKEGAYSITVRASSPEKAANMTNYIVDRLNKTIIDLNIRKARDNKNFLGGRYNEIKTNLKNAEDSLKLYQKRTGVLEAEGQTKATIEEFSKMEAELATKEIELSVIKKIFGKEAPQVKNQEIAVKEFKDKLTGLQSGTEKNSLLLPLKSLPDKAVNYLRYYRNVKIYSSMLEFIIPLYEQAKFDEQKEVPILQVIDYGVPPEKKSYPSRVLFSLIITFASLLIVFLIILIKEIVQNSDNPKMAMLRKEMRLIKKKE